MVDGRIAQVGGGHPRERLERRGARGRAVRPSRDRVARIQRQRRQVGHHEPVQARRRRLPGVHHGADGGRVAGGAAGDALDLERGGPRGVDGRHLGQSQPAGCCRPGGPPPASATGVNASNPSARSDTIVCDSAGVRGSVTVPAAATEHARLGAAPGFRGATSVYA